MEEALAAAKIHFEKEDEEKKERRRLFIENLSEFWKDVAGRVGMDVCTPFINRFRGHSFVSYDNGLVWSKTMRMGFNTSPSTTISINEIPKKCIELRGFGSDLNDLD